MSKNNVIHTIVFTPRQYEIVPPAPYEMQYVSDEYVSQYYVV